MTSQTLNFAAASQMAEGLVLGVARVAEPRSFLAVDDRELNAQPHARSRLQAWKAKRVMAYIDERLDHDLRREELSRVVGLSANHFGRAFVGAFGLSPREYILGRRVERAKTLMLRSRQPLAEIAFECGFADQAHMTRTFTRLVGLSPARWRRQRQTRLQ